METLHTYLQTYLHINLHTYLHSYLHTYMYLNIVLYCIVSIHLYSASCNAQKSEAFPVRETQREESSLRERKEVLGSPVSKVDRVEGRSWFQNADILAYMTAYIIAYVLACMMVLK